MTQKTILLVDDEAMLLRSVERILKREGWTIFTAGSVSDALVVFRREMGITEILSDACMPSMNGDDFHRLIAVELKERSVRFQVMSGQLPLEMALYFRAQDVRIHQKPFNYAELVAAVNPQG